MKYLIGYGNTALDDIGAIRDIAQTAEGAGIDYVTSSGHVLGAAANRYPDRPNATYTGPFYDPFVLFSYLSAITTTLRFRTSILILPLFPASVIAKQSSELSRMSGGRFELGIGISWNPDEYAALGANPRNRGRRMKEQVDVLRTLWSAPYPSYTGRYHTINGIGLGRVTPYKIPIVFGTGSEDSVLQRVAKLGDGWIPMGGDPAEPLARLKVHLKEAGREHDDFSITGRLLAGPDGPDAWIKEAQRLEGLGATHLNLAAPPDLSGKAMLDRLVQARQELGKALG